MSDSASSSSVAIAASSATDLDAASSSTAAAVPVALFKKKGGAKRKEFRAPAASLASRTDAPSAAAAAAPVAAEPAVAPSAAPSSGVQVEDDTAHDADAPASIAATAGSSSSSSLPSRAAAASKLDSSDSDSDDDFAPSSAAAAQAAEVDTSDPESDGEGQGGEGKDGSRSSSAAPVARRSAKRTRDSTLVSSTRAKASAAAGSSTGSSSDPASASSFLVRDGLTISSDRSAAPDTRSAASQITMEVSTSAIPPRDPKKPKWAGPQKPQAANVRSISRFDYQPNICKDYKETGYCGYGDSCVFMHDRGDYKQGWQLEKEWNEAQEAKRLRAAKGITDEDDAAGKDASEEDKLPWACGICRGSFVQPVVTKCGHYFCERCALQRYVQDTKCALCRAQTQGIFNAATKLEDVLKKRAASGVDKRRELEEEEKARRTQTAQ